MKQAPAFFLALLLFTCCYVPFPRSTYIHPGTVFDGGIGVGVDHYSDHEDWSSMSVVLGTARLGMNPSDRLGFDLCVHGMLYPRVPGLKNDYTQFWPDLSLAAKLRPLRKINTMLFVDGSLGLWYAGIAQGIPFTGPEVVTLGLTAGTWPWKSGMSLLEFYFEPGLDVVLCSVSWHGRSSRLRITPSLVGGYYGDMYPGRWLLAFTVSGAGRDR